MEPVSVRYSQLLDDGVKALRDDDDEWRQSPCDMVSSVTGDLIRATSLPANSNYWCQNLRQRVLFGPAVAKIGDDSESKNVWNARIFLEIGPHAALGGPFRQVKVPKAVYVPSLVRKVDDLASVLKAAGSLWALGYPVNLENVNFISSGHSATQSFKNRASSLLVDLPPYQWNYNQTYWAEPRASAEQRNLLHARHDLLGSRVSGLSPRSVVWSNILRHRDLPWLKDHSLGNIAVFPAAGYMSLAIEALQQVSKSLSRTIESVTLRDIDIATALGVPEVDDGIEIQTQLQCLPTAESKEWYSFTVESLVDGDWTTHCQGKIAANYTSVLPTFTSHVDLKTLTQRTSSKR